MIYLVREERLPHGQIAIAIAFLETDRALGGYLADGYCVVDEATYLDAWRRRDRLWYEERLNTLLAQRASVAAAARGPR